MIHFCNKPHTKSEAERREGLPGSQIGFTLCGHDVHLIGLATLSPVEARRSSLDWAAL
jgi:hypothetical protein